MTDAKNHFTKNRQKVQKAALTEFLKPISTDDLPLKIEEKKNANKKKITLRQVNIINVPVNDVNPLSYILEMEIENSHFSNPKSKGFKTVEKVILIFLKSSLYVVFVEMKSHLNLYEDGILGIEGKLIDSIGRISLFFTHYLLDMPKFDNYNIKYFGLIFYNTENIKHNLKGTPEYENHDLVKIFMKENKSGSCFLKDRLDGINMIEIVYGQNIPASEVFEFDLQSIFVGDEDFENAIYSDKTLP